MNHKELLDKYEQIIPSSRQLNDLNVGDIVNCVPEMYETCNLCSFIGQITEVTRSMETTYRVKYATIPGLGELDVTKRGITNIWVPKEAVVLVDIEDDKPKGKSNGSKK